MTDAERIAFLESENAQLRRALADQAAALAEHARRESAERERREARRRVNRQNYERRKGVVSVSDSDRIQTLNPPTPPLNGSPLPPAPSLPSPLSSPHPLFLSASPEASPQTATETLALALGGFPAPEEAAKKFSRRKQPAAKREPAGDPRHAPLVAALVAFHATEKGQPYGFDGGKDAKAVTGLLSLADQNPATRGEAAPAEILRRWGIALRWKGFPVCTGLASFREHWNNYVNSQDATKPTGDRPRLGPPAAPPRVSGDRPRI